MSCAPALRGPATASVPGRLSIGLLVGLLLGLLIGLLAGCSPAPEVSGAPSPTAAVAADRGAAALRTLDLGATADPGSYAAGLARTGRLLRLRQLSWRYAGPAPGAGGSPAVLADVTWRLPGDRRASTSRVTVALDGSAAVTGVRSAGTRWPTWLAGPVVVRRAPGVLVVAPGRGPAAERRAGAYAALARRALTVVGRVVPTPRPLVVEVAPSEAALTDALAGRPGEYAGVAAVTTTADAGRDADAPVRVTVDDRVLAPLGRRARLVVLAHEATHAETAAATARMPLWLLEGFADHVALRDVGLPTGRLAAHAVAAVRADGVPTRLPRARDFAGADAEAAYEQAWLAVQVLVDRGGEARLVRLYDRVEGGAGVRRALRQVFGTSQRTLTRVWGDRLARLAR